MQFTGQENNTEAKRSDVLTILCILSYVGSGLAAFSNLVLLITFDELGPVLDEMDFGFEGVEQIMAGGKSFFLSGFILYVVSLAGISAMWRLRRIGFHLYAAAQLFILLLPVVSIDGFPFSIPGMLLTGAFILGYFTQLKFMK